MSLIDDLEQKINGETITKMQFIERAIKMLNDSKESMLFVERDGVILSKGGYVLEVKDQELSDYFLLLAQRTPPPKNNPNEQEPENPYWRVIVQPF